ncbi:histone PARylation factor 1-like [Homarus americanus]|uniref:histone PARylation factor 1-like n=1 Tax=Homarus americanus TaxID=6706 RepID=UPI001C471DE6|nr:histone PARylation factor 1-like [Homarus americanus]
MMMRMVNYPYPCLKILMTTALNSLLSRRHSANIEQKFLVEMPDDFFDFWDCCVRLNKEKPEEALSKAGLTLVGPYDVLTRKLDGLKTRCRSSYACHWRYYYDPPEFMTVIAGDEKEYHIGYYRDDPFELPGFVGSMSSKNQGVIKALGGNIFGALHYLRDRMREHSKKAPLQRLYNEIELYAMKKLHSLEVETKSMKERKIVVSPTFHGGVLALPTTNAKLWRMMNRVVGSKTDWERRKHFEVIQDLIKNVQFAYDADDIGMGLELGLDMFTFGHELFHKPVYHVLGLAYDMLGREPYIDILQAHLKNRRQGSNLSIMEVVE